MMSPKPPCGRYRNLRRIEAMKAKPCFLAAMTALAVATAPVHAWDAQVHEWPTADGAVFAQRDANNLSPVVAFDAKGRSLMAFSSMMRGTALPGRFHEMICAGGSFVATGAGTWVGAKVSESGEFTIEAVLMPALAEPKEPGVALAFANGEDRDFTLLQDRDGLSFSVADAEPIRLFAPKIGEANHVLISCDPRTWAAYLDGEQQASGDTPADAARWGDREIIMGSAWAGEQPWYGRMREIAIFPRALTAEEAAAEAAASSALRAGHQPATTIRFKGTLLRQAKTSSLEDIRPYTRSLSFAEYKVDEVLEGEWDKPTIMVAHWMIMDGKRLPIADREAGAKVELSVQPMEQNPQLESSRRDEIEGADLDVPQFYSEPPIAP